MYVLITPGVALLTLLFVLVVYLMWRRENKKSQDPGNSRDEIRREDAEDVSLFSAGTITYRDSDS